MSDRVAQRETVSQLAQDRQTGVIERAASYDAQAAELRALGAKNWETPPLEPAPYIRIKATGEIHVWAPFFAARPDLCENCDVNGNTDPAAWRGQVAHPVPQMRPPTSRPPVQEAAVEKEPEPLPVQDIPPVPRDVQFFPERFLAGSSLEGVPDMNMAAVELGIDPVPDYTRLKQPARVLVLDNVNESVTAGIAAQFTR